MNKNEIPESNNEKLDMKEINVVIRLLKQMLKIVFVLAIILGIYVIIVLGKELGIFRVVLTLIKVISPLFIGVVIAWLFNPIVKFLEKKKLKRGLATVLIYIVFIGLLALVIGTLIPTLYEQIQDFVQIIPNIFDKIQEWINTIFKSLDGTSGLDMNSIKDGLFTKLENVGTDMAATLPETLISTISSLFSGIGNILVGLIIGFFLLISFDNSDSVIEFLPKKIQKVTREVLKRIDEALRTFVTGSVLDCSFIFIITSIGLYFVGLKAPLLFGLFCGITNIIPYAGPYIGGIPAVIVGFSQGIPTGILTLVVICVIQFLEGNFLQPVILSKTTKLHPVTIIIGLLVFGYFWGIVGMVISTPLIAAVKAVLLYFDEKYDILSFK